MAFDEMLKNRTKAFRDKVFGKSPQFCDDGLDELIYKCTDIHSLIRIRTSWLKNYRENKYECPCCKISFTERTKQFGNDYVEVQSQISIGPQLLLNEKFYLCLWCGATYIAKMRYLEEEENVNA